jgi:hypothetical protein
MFCLPLFNLEELFALVNNIFVARKGSVKQVLIDDLANSLEAMSKWLTQSGLNLIEENTEMCLFSKHDPVPITVPFGQSLIMSSESNNALRVIFILN